MCQGQQHAHDDLDDSLDGVFGGSVPKEDLTRPISNHMTGDHPVAGYVEICPDCRGSGRFHSYSGRYIGACHKCKGQGKLTFKTSIKERVASKQAYQAQKARTNQQSREDMLEWIENHPAEHNWIYANSPTFEFAASMAMALTRYGKLTEGQLAAVRKCVLRDQERREAREKQAAHAVTNAVVVSVQPIVEAFQRARANDVRSPKLRLTHFRFERAPDHGKNPGAIYVVDVDDNQQYLGKIIDGKLIRASACSDALEAEIVEVCADPHAAAVAYGRRYGSCSVCGRELTNHASIDAGIGPICAERYGWGG